MYTRYSRYKVNIGTRKKESRQHCASIFLGKNQHISLSLVTLIYFLTSESPCLFSQVFYTKTRCMRLELMIHFFLKDPEKKNPTFLMIRWIFHSRIIIIHCDEQSQQT